VRWLAVRYRLDHRDLPPCWYAHPDLVEELSALHTAHRAAYHPDSSPHGPTDWHQQLAATRHRLQTAIARTGCRPGEHRDTPTPAWARGDDPDYPAAFDRHVHDDLTRRATHGCGAR
jgi:hypothetical protein